MNTNFYLKKLRADKLMTVAFISAIVFFVGMIGLVVMFAKPYIEERGP